MYFIVYTDCCFISTASIVPMFVYQSMHHNGADNFEINCMHIMKTKIGLTVDNTGWYFVHTIKYYYNMPKVHLHFWKECVLC
jgi:hypothetical protein